MIHQNNSIYRLQTLANNIVLVDGFSGTGKSFLMPLLGHLENSELWQIMSSTERLAILDYLDLIDKESAKTLIQTDIDDRLYALQIGRNMNCRASDDSSIQKNLMEDKYISRQNNDISSKDIILENIATNKPLFIMDVHYKFGYSKLLFDAVYDRLDLYIIMLRNPLHLIYAYYKQDLHNKFGKDKINNTTMLKVGENYIPFFAKEYKNEYLEANDLEKIILIIYHHSQKVKTMYNQLTTKEKEKFLFIPFENISTEHEKYINMLSKRLNRKRDKNFVKIEKHFNLPRQKEPFDFDIINRLKNEMNITISREYETILDNLIDEYQEILKLY